MKPGLRFDFLSRFQSSRFWSVWTVSRFVSRSEMRKRPPRRAALVLSWVWPHGLQTDHVCYVREIRVQARHRERDERHMALPKDMVNSMRLPSMAEWGRP